MLAEQVIDGAGHELRIGGVTLLATDAAQTRREKLARVVLDGMVQFVGLLDAQGMTLEINRAALQGAGVDMDTIRGTPFWEARWFQVSRETVELQRSFVERARQGEFIRCDLEVFGRASGGETIVVDFSLLPVRDAAGEVVFLIAEGRDITLKKRAEAEVARKNAELQALLDRVRELDQLKSDLFANLSHELRTPLTLILGPLDELLGGPAALEAAQREHLQMARRNAGLLLKQVNDLLDLSKIDARQMHPAWQRCDLAQRMRLVAEQFQGLAQQRAMRYLVDVPGRLTAEVDAEKIERVALNLLSNAFKFTPEGGLVRLSLRAEGERALLSVQDSGPGIAPEHHGRVFERFRQLQAGTTRAHGGSGLGLAIAKEFVELHGGHISLSAAPGGGALFQVEVPLQAPAGADVIEEGRAGLALAGHEPGGQAAWSEPGDASSALSALADVVETGPARSRVLVVEDNAEMRRFITAALAGEHQVAAVGDGEAALAAALSLQPDLIVTDLMLPRLGGDQLIEGLRQHPALADTPVLVLSAKQDEALRTRLLAHLAQDYLTKPFSGHELRARVRNLSTMKRTRDALRRELATQSGDLSSLAAELILSRRALQDSEHRWAAMFDHSPVGIVIADEAGAIRSANPAFCSLLGQGREALCGLDLRRITPVEDQAEVARRLARLLAGEREREALVWRFQRPDTALVWTHSRMAHVNDAGGSGGNFLMLVAGDITERRRAEEALQTARNELARVSRVSTLGELAASIAHEVNQPLAAIMTNGHACLRWLAARPPDPAEAGAAARRIVRDAERAGEVITRIRAFLRHGELTREAVDLADLVGEVLGLLRGQAAEARVALQFDPAAAAGLPPVPVDRVQIQQVLLNLIINALEAMQPHGAGARRIDISLARCAAVDLAGEAGLAVCVRDSGVGIAAGRAGAIFEAFHTSKPGGMGMGLAISRSIVEAHGGRLELLPLPGPGATFRFCLPLAG